MASIDHSRLHECDFCQKIILGYSDEEKRDRNLPLSSGEAILKRLLPPKSSISAERSKLRNRNQVLFDLTLEDIETAAANGCTFSAWLHQYTSTQRTYVSRSWRDIPIMTLAAEVSDRGGKLQFGVPHMENRSSLYDRGTQEENDTFLIIHRRTVPLCQIIASPDRSAAKVIQTRPINTDPASESAFKLARRWLRTCLDNHGNCPHPISNFMPTRLIEIQVGQGWPVIRLHESGQQKVEPYATLSYCWGGEQVVKTTLSSVHRHLTRINIQDLPESIQEAILVTIELGLRFIWIDVLCIIQDDPHDMEIEIASMPSIYKQATLTISASRGSSVNEGFLRERTLDIPNVFKLPYRCPNGTIETVAFFPALKESTEPLDRRGWALQERLLSTRVLDYGSLQTRWTCLEKPQYADGNESWADGWKLMAVENSEKKDQLFRETLEMIHRVHSPQDNKLREKSTEQWERLVETYTRRSLTLSSDRLPAISGIAERFQTFHGDEYWAGLWKSDLPRGLFWKRDTLGAKKLRPSKYQGPSWSWASIDDPIKFPWFRPRKADSNFQIHKCTIIQNPKARFGAIKSGSLVVSGRIQTAEWSPANKPPNVRGQPGVLALDMDTDALEVQSFREDSAKVFLLIVFPAENEHSGPEGLVLRKDELEQYSRIGTFRFNRWSLERQSDEKYESVSRRYAEQIDWINDCKPQMITIV